MAPGRLPSEPLVKQHTFERKRFLNCSSSRSVTFLIKKYHTEQPTEIADKTSGKTIGELLAGTHEVAEAIAELLKMGGKALP
jgi:hypothetical protein